ncbi:MAG TPA: polysaccharide deacetylase family protein [Candidatus Sulfotelmatobacter sp.]|nr:polysaccharide deacetylase family protein [Candidatus Sulfotelmatobacter sp.]
MAKTKVRAKKSKKGINKKSGNKIPVFYFVILFFIILGLFVFGVLNLPHISKVKSLSIKSKIPLNKQKELTKLFLSPYPTKAAVQSPTPAPLTGYCLRVPVLMYHHVQPESDAKAKGQTSLTVDNGFFDSQMQYLSQNGYTTLFASELIDALRNHTQLPNKSVVVTMDDGYADNFIYALPVLQKYNLKANIMVATGLMGVSDMLSWDQVKSLKSSGLIYFTNHTWSHYAINHGPQDKINSEIDIAQKEIQDFTSQPVNVFTYPYGAFNNNAIQTLAQKGYTGAFSEIPGFYQCDSFIMTLHRTRIGNSSLSNYGL